jgi:hypothetical protein
MNGQAKGAASQSTIFSYIFDSIVLITLGVFKDNCFTTVTVGASSSTWAVHVFYAMRLAPGAMRAPVLPLQIPLPASG